MVTKKILYETVAASVASLFRSLPAFMRLPHIADLAEKFLEAVALRFNHHPVLLRLNFRSAHEKFIAVINVSE